MDKILTSMFLIGSSAFIGWLYWLTIRIGLWNELWKHDPYLASKLNSNDNIGLVVGAIDEHKTYKRLNK